LLAREPAPSQNNRAFQGRPAIVGANEEKGAPESATCGPGIRNSPCTNCPRTFTGTPAPQDVEQATKRSCCHDDGGCEI
jgi:hypothetical protein